MEIISQRARLSRRAVLSGASIIGAAALLQACAAAPTAAPAKPTEPPKPAAVAPAPPAASPAASPAVAAPAAAPQAPAAAAAAAKPAGPQATLTIAIDSDPQTLDPSTNLAFPVGSEIIMNVFDTLVAWKPPKFDVFEGRLAEKWEVSPDAKVYTFTLRSGVMFHDGTPCDAAAVRVAIERVKADNTFMTAYFGPIDAIDTPDAKTVKLTLKTPSAVFLSYLAMPQAAIHSPTNAKGLTKEQIGSKPVGTGPFKFESYTPDTEVVLSANPGYFRGAPTLQRIVYRVIKDQATRRLELEKGTIDVVQQNGNLFSLPIADIDALKKNKDVKVLEFDSQIIRNIDFDNADGTAGIMADKRIRQAIALSIDYDGLLSGVLGGTATRVYGPLTQSNWAVLPNIQDLAPKRDVAKAKQLLAEAGQPNLNLKMYTFQGSSWRDIGTFLQANLREAGINVEVVQLEFPALRQLHTAGEHDIVLDGRQPWYNDPDAHITIGYLSSLGPTALTLRMPKNDELDGLILKAQQSTKLDERKDFYFQIQRKLMEFTPAAYLFSPKIIIYTRANVENLIPNTAPPLTEYWQVRKA